MSVLLFHLLQLGCDLVALRSWRRAESDLERSAALGVALLGCTLLAWLGMLGETDDRFYGSAFTFLGLFAQGLFGHGIPLLCLVGWSALRGRPARRAPGFGLACLAVAALFVAAGVEGFVLGPRALEVTRYRVTSAKLARPLRLVVLSDLQADAIGAYERRAVRTALEQEPDVLLLPGDYLQAQPEHLPALSAELGRLLREEGFAAPLGVFAVEGNVDRPGWPSLFEGLDVRCFVRTEACDVGPLRLTGLSFHDSFDPGLVVPAEERFHVVLGHGPDFALGDVRADLLIAGHTHGGQVRLPGLGPLVTLSRVPRAWAAGRSELPGRGTLIVSRGVGMERGLAPRVRFFCRPEIVVVDLEPRAGPER